MTRQTRTARSTGRRAAPDEVWRRVRDDYLAGMSGPDACRRHGVRLTAMRQRAARERWRRMDQPWAPPPNRLDAQDEGVALEDRVGGDLDQVDFCELSYVAHRRMMRAVMRGDAAGALRWRRVRLAMDEEEAEVDRATAQDVAIGFERAGEAELAAIEAAAAHSAHSADAVHSTDAMHSTDATDAFF
ncbi:hypothetical protein [Brevundimonas sp.]|uniref:hypothetical protein n=1 Tax=Brevundimonas sp. TaxID=1871086 RepID=UPI002D51E20D|nr:hypothetical protein [Brevundimonas sp.]HYC67257.1 hypothetical protein [Brevundimonas sp.]